MASTNQICRLCFNNIEEEVQIINDNLTGLLQTLLCDIDLSISDDPVICQTCCKKSEDVYNFKKKCISTEDTLGPFVTKNEKINLNEVHSQVIKSGIRTDKNVCRLCFLYVDNDILLNEADKIQFRRFLPEINIDVTHLVIICPTCYDLLQKYFDFVTVGSEFEQLLCNYSLNFTEDNGSIKLENFQQFLKSEENQTEQNALTNEKVDKKNGEDLNEKFSEWNFIAEDPNTAAEEQSLFPQVTRCIEYTIYNCQNCDFKTENRKVMHEHMQTHVSGLIYDVLQCEECEFSCKNLETLRNHNQSVHVTSFISRTFKNRTSNFESSYENYVKDYIMGSYTEPPKMTYRCKKCPFTGKFKSHVRDHVLIKHSQLNINKAFRCVECNSDFGMRRHLTIHMRRVHRIMHQCVRCSYKAKNRDDLDRHFTLHHTKTRRMKAKPPKHKCNHCDFKCSSKNYLKHHEASFHKDISSRFPCSKCSRTFKQCYDLNKHFQQHHTKLGSKTYRCKKCNFEFYEKIILNFHLQNDHNIPSTGYKCEECEHVSLEPLDEMHSTRSKNAVYKCQFCNYKTKCKYNLERHTKIVHTAQQSKTNMFQSQFLEYLKI